jgi:hypothetical protein
MSSRSIANPGIGSSPAGSVPALSVLDADAGLVIAVTRAAAVRAPTVPLAGYSRRVSWKVRTADFVSVPK